MARQNPKIEAQKEILNMLLKINFDEAIDRYDGIYIDDRWKPKWHYMQGIDHYKQIIEDNLWQLEEEQREWEEANKKKGASHSSQN